MSSRTAVWTAARRPPAGRRSTLALLAVIALVTGVALSPATAHAAGTTTGGSAFDLGLPSVSGATTTTTAPTVVTTGTTSGSGGLSGGDAILIAVVAVVLLGGIAWYVWADSRKHASARIRAGSEAELTDRRSGSKAPQKSRKLSAAEKKRRKRGAAPRRR